MSKLKILFEAGPMIDSKKTGVGYFVDRLMVSLSETYGDKLELTGYYFNFLKRNPERLPPDSNLKFLRIWLIPGKILSVCRRLGFQPVLELFTRKNADFVIFTNYVMLPSLRKRKTVLIVYDLSFLDWPEFTQARNLSYLKRFCPPSIQKADLIITISEFTKARLRHYFPDLKANIVVTPIPPPVIGTSSTILSDKLDDMGIKKGRYILYLGTIEPRKNLQALVAAYSLLDASLTSRYSLVLAGGKGWKDEAILADIATQKKRGHDIILTGYVADEEKQALYANAACFVLPSHYEGFGMPVLEAMEYKLPVGLSDIPVFHEVAGKAAEYFNAEDPRDIANKVSLLLTDPATRDRLIAHATDQLATFNWQENAERVFEALHELG